CDYVISHIFREQGDTAAAIARLQHAASSARDAGDLELLSRAQLKLFLIVADLSGSDAAAPILAELRRLTARLGIPETTAAVHVFVAQIEASKGLFHSAQRHLGIAN